jgi:hypothetical protein
VLDISLRRFAGLLTTLLLAIPVVVLNASSASAYGTPGCVTHAEYRRVHKGYTVARVKRIFDARGKIISQGYGYQEREFKPCTDRRYGFVDITFYHKRLDSKSAYWG